MKQPKERQKHDYTSEMELKSLLIRVRNKRLDLCQSERWNYRINKYIKTYTKLNNIQYKDPKKKAHRFTLREKLKNKIIELSLVTKIDYETYNAFGSIILLMIKNILKKPNFSGYTYVDDFYSDAIHKIIKYLHNFDYTKISKTTGTNVNSFAYISQIIHNSIIHIINTKNKQQQLVKQYIHDTISDCSIDVQEYEINNSSSIEDKLKVISEFKIKEIFSDDSLYNKITELSSLFKDNSVITIIYPKEYRISFKEYDLINDLTNKLRQENKINTNVIRCRKGLAC